MNVIDYFDRARIINIPSRNDRRMETMQEFARHGFSIDFEKIGFFDAVTPSEGRASQVLGRGVLSEPSRYWKTPSDQK